MTKRSLQTIGRCAGLALLLSVASTAWAQREPVPRLLPPLPGDDGGIAYAINNKGVAVGVSWGADESSLSTAVKWSRKRKATALPPLLGHTQSFAQDINLRGEVAGASFADDDPYVAVRWDVAGQPHALPPLPGDTASYARGINNVG